MLLTIKQATLFTSFPTVKLIPTQSKAIAAAGIAWLRSQQQLLDHLSCATL
nr:hypothetical protein [Nostoc sp. DedQUE01]